LKEIFFVVSKDNEWSASLVDNLSKKFECRYYNDVSYVEDIPRLNPSWIFFFHWSDIVSSQVHANNRCVVIHTGNLPRNRGGSPLQNQIMEGIVDSRVNAIEMVEEVDAGAIYCSLPITLQGNLRDIWMTISDRAYDLICECIEGTALPKKQEGERQVYRRRKNNEIDFRETSNFPDNAMDSVPLLSLCKFIEESVSFTPDLIFTHHPDCLNVDHGRVYSSTVTAFRPQRGESMSIYSYYVPSSTDYNPLNNFQGNVYVDVKNYVATKMKCLREVYGGEMREYPHSRSYKNVENLMKVWGSEVGLEYAEKFQLIRKIV